MPVPPPPLKITCRACGWHCIYRPRSDVLMLPEACAACGSTDLACTVAPAPVGLLERLIERLRGRGRFGP